jgi:hypothetical protein
MNFRMRAARGVVAVAVAGIAMVGVVGHVSATPSQECSVSHNSDTGNGANTSGAYDSTCDGSASQNGQGGAQPCAGCVGNADDKNPPGQAPDGTDHNNGYECDGNNGIGKTNPAHTGCVPPSS